MAGPYQRLSNGASADTGAQAIITVVNAIEAGLEDVEAALPGKASTSALTAHEADTTNIHGIANTSLLETTAGATSKANAAQAAAVQRANHTGTQLASTISDFNTAVRTNRLDQMAAPTASVGMGSQRITALASPSASTDAATKGYVDSAVGGAPAGSNVISAADYGAVADGRVIAVVTTASSTTILANDPTNLFAPSDVGKVLWINAAGTAGAIHACTISTVAGGGGSITVTPAPVSSVTAAAVCGTDNTTALNNWCAAATPFCTLYLPSGGERFYMTQGGHVIPDFATNVRGDGSWLSQFMTRTNNNILTRSAALGQVSDIGFQHVAAPSLNLGFSNGSWPTAGSGLKLEGSVSPWDGGFTERILTSGLYRGVWIEGGVTAVRDSLILSSLRAGIECYNPGWPDYGGYRFTGNWISSRGPGSAGYAPASFAGVLWGGSGGLEVSSNWIDGGQNHVYLNPSSSSGQTGNIRIVGNSLEDWGWGGAGNAVQYDMSLTNAYQAYIVIANNVLQTQDAKTDPAFKLFAASNPSPDGLGNYGLRSIAITGNAGKFTGYLADLARCRDVSVTGNTVMGKVTADLVTQANCTNVTVA
jgi:hypothetical protein